MSQERQCPLCNSRTIPPWRCLCPKCFDNVRWDLRADLVNAYRLRVLNQTRYQELLAAARLDMER